MLELLKKEANRTYTENGAVTYLTTGSDCLDLFATIGALRGASEDEIIKRFSRAYAENPDLAMKTLFFARDIRGGLGERRVFRIVFNYLAENEPEAVKKNIANVAEYGRFDDLLVLLNTPCERELISYIEGQLEADILCEEGADISLLAKWLPSVNATNPATVKAAKRIAAGLKMSDSQYRKTLSMLRKRMRIIENNLREKDYSFAYEQQPSKALYKYRKAFIRNDGERYSLFLQRADENPFLMNTATLTPYDIIAPVFSRGYNCENFSEEERRSMNTTWNSLEDYAGSDNALVVVDGSGSMYGYTNPMPAAVAQSLGIYFAERNKGAFRNHFITFSCNPRLVEIKGKDIVEKVRYCQKYNECSNTDLMKTFKLLLDTAIKNKLPQSEMPSRLYIISDMEFDYCASNAEVTNFECAKKMFEDNGYKFPMVVFWNVASRNTQQPVRSNEQGVALVSGCNPAIFAMLKEDSLNPYKYMLSILSSERYERVAA